MNATTNTKQFERTQRQVAAAFSYVTNHGPARETYLPGYTVEQVVEMRQFIDLLVETNTYQAFVHATAGVLLDMDGRYSFRAAVQMLYDEAAAGETSYYLTVIEPKLAELEEEELPGGCLLDEETYFVRLDFGPIA